MTRDDITGAAERLTTEARGLGLTVRQDQSSLSNSIYLSIDSPLRRDQWPGFTTKRRRGAWCRALGMSFPSGVPFKVRISDHHDYGDGSARYGATHASVRRPEQVPLVIEAMRHLAAGGN